MTRETKLALRRRVLSVLRAIVWHADEWLHRQEVALREELSLRLPVEPPRPARPQGPTVSCPYPVPTDELLRDSIRGRFPGDRLPQRTTKSRRRRMTAAEFDLRFAR